MEPLRLRILRWSFILSALGFLGALHPVAAAAALLDITDSGEGWLTSDGFNDGNFAQNNYLAGGDAGLGHRNHFDFAIPTFADLPTTARLILDDPASAGGTQTYSLYSLGTFGTYDFSDIGQGAVYGTANIPPNDFAVTVSLKSDALAAIIADQGGTFSLGGVDSGETAGGFQFGDTLSDNATLELATSIAAVPEPTSLAVFGAALAGFAVMRRRKRA
jgi:PEP-CTERM motif